MSPKNGLHFAGVLLIPPFNRLKRGVKEHFEVEQRIYIRPGFPLQRIHIEHIRTTPKRAVDYTFKALKKGRVGPDDLLILPAVG
jgi:hypothetical protein